MVQTFHQDGACDHVLNVIYWLKGPPLSLGDTWGHGRRRNANMRVILDQAEHAAQKAKGRQLKRVRTRNAY